MTTHISRMDALIVQQVSTLTPTVTNSATYKAKINTKIPATYTADSATSAQEIVEGLQALLADLTTPPEFVEITWTEDNATIIATGADTGEIFTVLDGGGTAAFTPATTTTAKSPNHWIAENFSSGSLPANGDTVYIQGLATTQSIKWGLGQSAVQLLLLQIQADSLAEIGLPEIHGSGTDAYYEYRPTFLAIGADSLVIGDGSGQGSGRIKIDLGASPSNVTIYKTSSNPSDPDEAAVHLVGGGAGTIQMLAGTLDLAMLPGYSASFATIVASGGTIRCGSGVTLVTVEAAGNSTIETRSGSTTLRTRDTGQIIHYGGNVTTADVQGGNLTVRAGATLTIAQLNGYGGKTLDLSECDSLVTVTAMTIYATPSNPFTINDPNNRLVMTNAASTPNGAQSLVLITGSGKNIRLT